jgi:hypothetical protein
LERVIAVVWIATIIGAAGTVICAWFAWTETRARWELHRARKELRRTVGAWKTASEGRSFREARFRRAGYVEIEEHGGRLHIISGRGGSADPPSWALAWMSDEDASRYLLEWGAHLRELIDEGELEQARRDRRRLAFAAISLAVALRVRRALRRTR